MFHQIASLGVNMYVLLQQELTFPICQFAEYPPETRAKVDRTDHAQTLLVGATESRTQQRRLSASGRFGGEDKHK